jgi:hypothetical protein
MRTGNFCFIALLFFSFTGQAQSVKHVNLTQRVIDDNYTKSQAVVPIFKYVADSIEEFTRFGLEDDKPLKKFKIKLPDMSGCMDTAYGYLYFGAILREVNPGYRMVLVGNYRRRYMKKALVFIDHNDNLDLSDDGPPDTLFGSDTHLDVIMRNAAAPEGKYIVRLSYFEFGQNAAYKLMLNEHYRKHSGSKIFTNADFCFREQRLNVIAGDYNDGLDSFRFAVQDANCNGLYNDAGVDKIYIVPYRTYKVTDKPQTLLDEKNALKTTFEWNLKQYKLTALDAAGRFVEFARNEGGKLKYALNEGKKVPKITFQSSDGKKLKEEKLRRYRGQWVYLYFWNSNSPGLNEDTATLRKIQNFYCNKVTIIAMNYGDNVVGLNRFINFSSPNWKNALSSREINELFFIKQMPAGFLLRRGNRLVEQNFTPQELLSKLESGKSLRKVYRKEKKQAK